MTSISNQKFNLYEKSDSEDKWITGYILTQTMEKPEEISLSYTYGNILVTNVVLSPISNIKPYSLLPSTFVLLNSFLICVHALDGLMEVKLLLYISCSFTTVYTLI